MRNFEKQCVKQTNKVLPRAVSLVKNTFIVTKNIFPDWLFIKKNQPSDLNLQRSMQFCLMVYLRVKVDFLRMTRVLVSSIPPYTLMVQVHY